MEKSKSTVALYTAQAKVLQHYTAAAQGIVVYLKWLRRRREQILYSKTYCYADKRLAQTHPGRQPYINHLKKKVIENQTKKYFSAGGEKLEKSKSTVALYTAQAKVLQHYTAGLSRAELTNGRRRSAKIWAGHIAKRTVMQTSGLHKLILAGSLI